MTAWRVFVGMWDDGDPDLTLVNQTFDDYTEAREALAARYERWRSDSCEDCVRTAAEDEAWLNSLPDQAEFVGNVEGDDHLLIRADRIVLDELWDARLAKETP